MSTPAGSVPPVLKDLSSRFPDLKLTVQPTRDGIPTVWVPRGRLHEVLAGLKDALSYRMLFDLTATDERERRTRPVDLPGDYTVIYHLMSLDRNEDVRVKAALSEDDLSIPTVTDLFPNADWYEREVYDMFGIDVAGHPYLRRILLPPWWEGHPLRKDYPARATEWGSMATAANAWNDHDRMLEFRPEDRGFATKGEDFDYLFVNLGAQHPGSHGPLRVVMQMDGQEVKDLVCEIGFHHRADEKTGERQTWHTFIPYTDRVDYLGGVLNNFPYVLAVEALAGITVPDRATVIRVMLAELFRIISHLVFFGTLAQDLGAMSPVFYMFNDRERAFAVIEAITGGRMHPSWFRIGGVAADLPPGWDDLIRDFLAFLPGRLDEYEGMVMKNRIFRERTRGIGVITAEEAVAWGASGCMLRSTGIDWDLRKKRPYGGYERFEFEVPTGVHGDVYDRTALHVEEMRQSLGIIRQCLEHMPAGPVKSDHPLATPPRKEATLRDIETLIHHFLGVTWGPVIPPGEACAMGETGKGMACYYLVSDGNTNSYRTRIRTPSFAHIQMVPFMSRGMMLPDLISVLGGIDFVLADVDR